MAKRTNTKTLATVAAINSLITANKSAFKPGTSMSATDFIALASQVLPRPTSANPAAYNLQLVGLYTKFNKLLQHRGLIIKAKDYYTSFHVIDNSKVATEVDRISARATACASMATNLQTGAANFNSKFSKLKPNELVRVSAHFNRGF